MAVVYFTELYYGGRPESLYGRVPEQLYGGRLESMYINEP
ncbi:hypothetical protein MTO96_044610, partial [Rhipicephalus appendiculatus]